MRHNNKQLLDKLLRQGRKKYTAKRGPTGRLSGLTITTVWR